MLKYFARNFLIKIIKFYQQTISFDHSKMGKVLFPHGYCRFHPTCSEYGVLAIGKYGVIKGGVKTLWRIFRCNPFSKGGHDPVK